MKKLDMDCQSGGFVLGEVDFNRIILTIPDEQLVSICLTKTETETLIDWLKETKEELIED
jgi:hypothetical protein